VDITRCGRNVRVVVHRDDGATLETLTTVAKGGLLPHDIEHFVVENAVGLTSGLWGRVAAGAEFNTFRVTTNKPRRRPRSEGRALTRGMNGWDEHIIGVAIKCYRAGVAVGWAPPDPLPKSLPIERDLARVAGTIERDFTRADVDRASAALFDCVAAWAATAEGDTLSLAWTVRNTFKQKVGRR
jgi:hypothetical protein